MWRTRAVISMLVEDVASLKIDSVTDHDAVDGYMEASLRALDRASRRARLVVVVDWLAILILFLFRDASRPFLPGDQGVETVFTLGVLAVAAHSGFRAAQLGCFRNLARLCEDLRQRDKG